MKKIYNAALLIFFVLIEFYLVGCDDKFLNPSEIGRYRPVPAVNVILNSLGVAEETPPAWAGAEDPRPADLTFYETDYTFGPGDVIRVNIFELIQEGVPYWDDYTVTETGNISLPAEVGIINVVGLTESQLENEVKRILSPGILKDPVVSVTLLSSQKYYYSISGEGIVNPGRIPFPRTNFRLSDAIAIAGGVSQFNTSYIYVTRQVTGREDLLEPEVPAVRPEEPLKPLEAPRDELLDIITPHAKKKALRNDLLIVTAEMAGQNEIATPGSEELTDAALPEVLKTLPDNGTVNQGNWIFDEITGKWIQVGPGTEPGVEEILPELQPRTERPIEDPAEEPEIREMIQEPQIDQPGEVEWIFRDGRWVPVRAGEPEAVEPERRERPVTEQPLERSIETEPEWEQIGTGGLQTRVIRIPVDGLYGGNYRFDIAIRPGDRIYVPRDIVGEFYVEGHVNNRGVINLTGRPMTLKMAIAAAGGLGPLAWPKRCEVVRRIGKEKEEIVMVDLDKIASGEQPDFFIKPNDMIRVGTHVTARWRAAIRNAFRASYGFAFVYDRNFSDRDFGLDNPLGPFGL